ncbi:putative BCR, YitT family [Bacteroidales bacterium Barb6XT]|nr:putative BCR, YitT family [Bacteroidales bacterium Barb6XT]
MKQKPILKAYYSVRDYLLIFVGTLLYAFGFHGFILSNGIVIGGVSGLATLIFFATSIPVSISYLTINIVLLAFAFKILGLKFIVKTMFGVVALSVNLSLFEWLLGGVPIVDGEPFMAIIIGGILCGTALGLIFSANGSTGGTDILAAIVNKYKNISIGTGILLFDTVIIASSYLLFHDIDKIVFAFVEMGVNSYVLDRIINANRQSVQFLIFSQKYDEITERIIKEIGRGCTLLDGEGGYSKRPTKVIVLLVKKSEALNVFRLVKETDSHAFISQSIVRGVYGEGFDPIKI